MNSTERFADLGKLNFTLGLSQFSILTQMPKKTMLGLKGGQNCLKNKQLESLI